MRATNPNVQALSDRFANFNQQLIAFVEECTTDGWHKISQAEGWPVGVTAHHIGATHYPVIGWVQMIVEGKALPPVTMAMIDQGNSQHAQAQDHCTHAAVLEILRRDGDKAIAYLRTINDADLERLGYVPVLETNLSAGQVFAAILIDSAKGHLESMRAAVQG